MKQIGCGWCNGVWLINSYILYQISVVFQTVGMDVFMTTYNYPKSLHLHVFNVREKPHKLIFFIFFKTTCQHLYFSQEAL